ncbi:TetR/AcrR family transcriptional regulator [Paractinoplanes lichenicola]|uniref:TetR family transcriptional regulator n=1 Tax=Paractinoplanes lichenicola TaxID=2802976 RepID=A0ABS1VLC7_9ACTN|nr:TetR/AcrR family transcriptional regulator [Actinoplanes lichenicola]MBL7255533.1 TetR family transcriptional regulator [Actinoplanes lichenicola]
MSLRERKKQATREALSAAALRLALEHGPERVRVDDIAEAAGVSPRTYNNYFPSRDHAIVAALTADRTARLSPDGPLSDAVIEAVIGLYTADAAAGDAAAGDAGDDAAGDAAAGDAGDDAAGDAAAGDGAAGEAPDAGNVGDVLTRSSAAWTAAPPPAEALAMISASTSLRACYVDSMTTLDGPAIVARHPEIDALTAEVLAAAANAAVRVALERWLGAANVPPSMPGFVIPSGSLPDLVRAALLPLRPSLDAATDGRTAPA